MLLACLALFILIQRQIAPFSIRQRSPTGFLPVGVSDFSLEKDFTRVGPIASIIALGRWVCLKESLLISEEVNTGELGLRRRART
ncbi:hypothetical protein BDV06DRAFT_190883 [Aspergillus oleicola]